MINKFLALPLFIAAGVMAHPAPVVRRDIPSLSQWASSGLESYWSFKVRFQSLSCSGQEGSDFYNTCCNPLPAGQTTANLPAECQPATLTCASSSPNTLTVTTSSAAPAPSDNGATTQSTDNGSDDGEEDCDDGSDDDYSDDSYTPPADNSGTTTTTTTTDNSGSSDNSGTYTTDNSNSGSNNNNSGNTGSTDNSGNTGSTNTGGSVNTGGFATFYYQNGNAGACGQFHSDSDYIGAIDVAWYGDMGQQSQYCGRSVQVTNLNNGKSVTIVVADVCPTCATNNSFDLSYGAFTAIAAEADGQVPITWQFV